MCDEREPCGQRGAQAAQISTRKIEMLYQLKHSLASTTTLPAGLRCNRRAAQAPNVGTFKLARRPLWMRLL